MIQIKKTILTLVALLAVTTGAWADYTVTWEGTTLQGIAVSSNSVHAPNTTQTVEGITVTASKGDFFYNTTYPTGPVVMAESSADNGLVFSAENNIKSIAITFTVMASYGGSMAFEAGAHTYQVSPAAKSFALPKNDTFTGITKVVFTLEGDAPSAGSTPTVAWNKAEKTGTFDMPGGNVELEPEYYPQAALTAAPTAINDVPATTDGAIVKAGTVATIGSTANAQGTVMYYVSKDALDDAALLALAADAWTADVPTAADLAQGQAYVYYYVRGNDSDTDDENFSDGDIKATNALTVTIAAEPTYAVTFADDLAEPDEWTASPAAGVKKGQTVTVTYTGTKKVIGVKAEKKAAPKALAEATAEDYGKVMCDKGHLHDAKTAVPTGCTAVGILGKVTGDGHGLILALQDATEQRWNTINGWTSVDTYAGTTLKLLPDDTARGSLTSYTTLGETAVSNWAVAQKSDYEAIFQNLGSTQHDQDGYVYDGNVNDYITTGVGGTAISDKYWSATLDSGNWAYDFESEFWNITGMSNSLKVRPVLGF